MKSNNGITLIALVVTIVVLLILAGVSISMLTGENGIIKQAQNAKEKSEIGEEKEAISVAYSGAKIKKEGTEVTAKDVQDQFNYNETKANASGNIKIQFTDSKRWYSIDNSGNIEGPFESEDEKVTDWVNIVISKTPESEPSGSVLLKVEKVEGLDGNVILDDIDVNTLSEDEKKDIIIKYIVYSDKKYKSFNELIENEFEGNEQMFWQEYIGDLDEYIEYEINYYKEKEIVFIPCYTVINPTNEVSDTYLATENDVYTFTIVDVVTGETYEKAVEVTNIDTSLEYYVSNKKWIVYLLDKTDNPVDFENAYFIYKGERIDVTSCIDKKDGYCELSISSIAYFLENIGKIENRHEFQHTTQIFELMKDGKSYFGGIVVAVWPE